MAQLILHNCPHNVLSEKMSFKESSFKKINNTVSQMEMFTLYMGEVIIIKAYRYMYVSSMQDLSIIYFTNFLLLYSFPGKQVISSQQLHIS